MQPPHALLYEMIHNVLPTLVVVSWRDSTTHCLWVRLPYTSFRCHFSSERHASCAPQLRAGLEAYMDCT